MVMDVARVRSRRQSRRKNKLVSIDAVRHVTSTCETQMACDRQERRMRVNQRGTRLRSTPAVLREGKARDASGEREAEATRARRG